MTYDDYMASVGLTAGSYAPQNTALCQGQQLAIAQNDALFYLLGRTYGGDGVITFALPNLAGAVPFGTGRQPNTSTNWQLGQTDVPLTNLAWPSGSPAAVASGGTPTVPVASGPAGLALNWAITLQGIFPPQPD
jgi:microcystin-dependent protein